MWNVRSIVSLAIWLTLVPALPAAHTAASLLLSHEACKPGETVWAGVRLRMEPGWHIYWQNSGDSGKPTTIHWQLPTNVTAGALAWPVPEKFVSSGLTTYVYHDEIMLLTPLKIDEAALPGSVDLSANVRWFECSRDEMFVASGLTTYVYHDEIMLLTPLKIDEAALPGSVDLSANVRWFECSRD